MANVDAHHVGAVAQGVQVLLLHHQILLVFKGVEPGGVGADGDIFDVHRPDEADVFVPAVQRVHGLVVQAAVA